MTTQESGGPAATPEQTRTQPRTGRQESPEERADRRWSEMLQEVRVAQTGSQILFGFLLSVAFMPRFAELGAFDRGLYVVAVVLGALATAALTAPVSYHRVLAGRRLKPQLVDGAARLVGAGLVLLALAVGSALLLLLRVATGAAAAAGIAAGVMLWFATCWLFLPVHALRHYLANGHGNTSGHANASANGHGHGHANANGQDRGHHRP
ncbi:hypothetical protein J5Y04_12935 [Kitasatospora sp. RG8]|uniref:DUF6328 family protein n=1 Tax=Kitasatospora sp. RG8 TaxID=2820815 RepID=UPI001ADF9453|nr:DUF6328 family protein [Kitasatospora sp. RG8]MBP0450456.1 hypothetical protein [Kitasatospora sp. RG8]